MPPDPGEVGNPQPVPDRATPDPDPVVGVQEEAHQGHAREPQRQPGARHTEDAAMGPLEVGEAPAEGDEGQGLQQVGDQRPEDRHVQQDRAHGHLTEDRVGVLDHERHEEPQHGAHDQRDMRRLMLAVGARKPMREVAGPRESKDVAAVRVDDRVEAGDQAGHRDQREQPRAHVVAEDGSEAQEQRLVAGPHPGRPRVDSRVGEQHHERGQHQRRQRPAERAREVSHGVTRLFGGQRELLDRQEEPHRKGERPEDPRPAVRQEARLAGLRFDAQSQVPGEVREGHDRKHHQDSQRHQRRQDRHPEGQLDPAHVEANEQRVRAQPPERRRGRRGLEDGAQVAADPHHDDRRGQDVLDVGGEPGDEPAPRTEGRAGERVGPAGVRQRRRELGDTRAQARVEHGRQERREQQPPEAPDCEAEVPAEEVAGDDRPDTKRPQRPRAGVAPQAALVEEGGVLVLIRNGVPAHALPP